MNKKILYSLVDEYTEKREIAKRKFDLKLHDIYTKYPELKRIDDEISSVGLKLLKAAIEDGDNYISVCDKIKQETIDLKKQRDSFMKKHSLTEKMFEPDYECPLCKDEGLINNEMCTCFKKELALRLYRESGLGSALECQTFDNFNLLYYKKGNTEEGFNYMSNLYSNAKDYAYNFNGKGNVLMLGGTGLGKTHLSSAIAKVIIEKGYTVVYDSAQKIFDAYEDKKFGRNVNADTEKFEKADLLIIDDLGTENVTQFSVSVLYNLINLRCNNNKAMIINTNLSPEELKITYKPRIFSRLFGEFKIMHFKGMDIRLQKLGE